MDPRSRLHRPSTGSVRALRRQQLHWIRSKNGDSRTFPLNTIALDSLQALRGEQTRPGAAPAFPSMRTGNALQGSCGWVSTALEETKTEEYTWHCNRPAFAGRLVMAGVDLRTVAELLGHRTLQMVMRFAQLAPEHQASAVDRLVPAQGRMVTKSATENSNAKHLKQTKTVIHRKQMS